MAPAAVVGQLLADSDGEVHGGTALAIALVQLLGFCFAGWVVRKYSPSAPIATCAAAGVVCWAILQAVGIVTTLVRGNDLSPLTWVATGLMAAVAAAAGGLLTRVQPRSPEDTP